MASKTSSKRAGKNLSGATKSNSRRKSGYVVFISHSSKETWIAAQIAKEVRAVGGEPWFDRNAVRGGDDFQREIMGAIRSCTEAIVLISPHSTDSQWVPFEIGAVAVQGKRVTPVLNNASPEAMAPLRRVSAIDLNDFDDFLKQLKERIRRRGRRGRR